MSKVCCDIQSKLIQFIYQEKHLKNDHIKYATIKNINTAQKLKMVGIEMYILQTRLVQFKYQEKLKTYLIVRIELFLIENNLKQFHKYK